jgi:hypothetical protein
MRHGEAESLLLRRVSANDADDVPIGIELA